MVNVNVTLTLTLTLQDPKNEAAHRLYAKLGYVKIKGSVGDSKQVTWAPYLSPVSPLDLDSKQVARNPWAHQISYRSPLDLP